MFRNLGILGKSGKGKRPEQSLSVAGSSSVAGDSSASAPDGASYSPVEEATTPPMPASPYASLVPQSNALEILKRLEQERQQERGQRIRDFFDLEHRLQVCYANCNRTRPPSPKSVETMKEEVEFKEALEAEEQKKPSLTTQEKINFWVDEAKKIQGDLDDCYEAYLKIKSNVLRKTYY